MSEDKVEYVRTQGDEDAAEVQAAILAPGVGGEVHYKDPWPTDTEYRELAQEGLVWAAQIHADGGVHHAAIFRKLANGILTLINHLAETRQTIPVEVFNDLADLNLRVRGSRALLAAEQRKVTYLRETLQYAALEYPHVGVFQTVLEETK